MMRRASVMNGRPRERRDEVRQHLRARITRFFRVKLHGEEIPALERGDERRR